MNIQGKSELAEGFRSASQIARVITEDWCTREMFCPCCDGAALTKTPTGFPACDFTCDSCNERFEVKSGKSALVGRIPDSAYGAMIAAIRNDRTPNLLAMQYSASFEVLNLLLIPRYFFTESVIEKRKPLSPNARRAGWVGCNILLGRIPADGRIAVVVDRLPLEESHVREQFARAKALNQVSTPERGWTLDVLNGIRGLGRKEFTLEEAYSLESELAHLHPGNRHIREKIRQQLQVLRDLGFLHFVERGRYSLPIKLGY